LKILFLRDTGFGDTLWTEPVVQALLDKGHEINLFVPHPSVFANHPSPKLHLNDWNFFPWEEEPINLSLRYDPKMHVLEAYRKQLGLQDMKLRYPQLYLSEHEKTRRIQGDYALLHLDLYTAPQNLPRNIYGIEWEKVTEFLKAKGITPLQITGRSTLSVAPVTPTSDFRDVISLMLHAKLFIGLDSGPSHIAALMRIPSVLFFGYVNPLYRHLDQKRKVFLQSSCPFAHCYHESKTEIPTCRRVEPGEAPPCCINDTKSVLEAIEKALKTD